MFGIPAHAAWSRGVIFSLDQVEHCPLPDGRRGRVNVALLHRLPAVTEHLYWADPVDSSTNAELRILLQRLPTREWPPSAGNVDGSLPRRRRATAITAVGAEAVSYRIIARNITKKQWSASAVGSVCRRKDRSTFYRASVHHQGQNRGMIKRG